MARWQRWQWRHRWSGGTWRRQAVAVARPRPTLTNFTGSLRVAAGANGVGQFVNFTWTTTNATAFTVTPNINGDDQTLPLRRFLSGYRRSDQTTTFTGIATIPERQQSPPATVTLTVVPVTLSASTTTIQAGGPSPDLRRTEQQQLLVAAYRWQPESHAAARSYLQRQHLYRHLHHRSAKHQHDVYRVSHGSGRRQA